jgi:hypothetical protein
MKLRRPAIILLSISLLISLVSACSITGGNPTPTPQGIYSIDPLFQKLYGHLGGADILGPAISPIFEDKGRIYQYVDAGLLMYDPNLPRSQRPDLAPLGRDMGVYELPAGKTVTTQGTYADGHLIYDKFVPLYEKLGGEDTVGKALTEVHRNTEKNRYEQYFENLGFYWVEGDSPDNVHLLSYGAWKCDQSCRHSPPENSRINLPIRTAAPFVSEVAREGLDFTGYALTEPYLAPDGLLEQIYENVVLTLDPATPQEVRLLDLPEKVGITRDELVPQSLDGDMYFYPIQDGLGYNIPSYFMEYIQQHGGMDYIGAPITQLIQQSDQTTRQCFVNMCLEAAPDASGKLIVRPVSLGLKYRDLYFKPEQLNLNPDQAVDITMQIWEDYPIVPPIQEQTIGVVVYGDNVPIAGVEPDLELTLPDGSLKTYVMPPTGIDGQSQVKVEPLNARNGTLVPYKICVGTRAGHKFCVIDSYLIWMTEYVTVTPLAPTQFKGYLPFILKNASVYVPAVIESMITYLPLVIAGR